MLLLLAWVLLMLDEDMNLVERVIQSERRSPFRATSGHVRCTPMSRHRQADRLCPKSAKNGFRVLRRSILARGPTSPGFSAVSIPVRPPGTIGSPEWPELIVVRPTDLPTAVIAAPLTAEQPGIS
jgi:hypothetical protein